ncbi:hypothetical protein CJ030_MR8G008952 [Morella rubra]|uniref:Uncharacterized protein n=1 Tax=Morella rubra TaxID=262757 RepID=A0A6A1UVL0_9ROSI|nr:hypothetical protein CJ030_MR8G008952 [Morella rubra]
MSMRRSFGFQQQCYSVHQEAQVQQSYSMHQEAAWHSNNQYSNQFQSAEIMPSPPCLDSQFLKHHNKFTSGKHNLHQSGWLGHDAHQNGWYGTTGCYNHVSGSERLPFNGLNSHFPHGAMFANEMEEKTEYETFDEMHVPTIVRVREIRYEQGSWVDHNGHHCRIYDKNINQKNNGYGKAVWEPEGL